jgi:hypothetical protein
LPEWRADAFRGKADCLVAYARDYSFSTRRDLAFFSSIVWLGVAGFSEECSLSSGLGW